MHLRRIFRENSRRSRVSSCQDAPLCGNAKLRGRGNLPFAGFASSSPLSHGGFSKTAALSVSSPLWDGGTACSKTRPQPAPAPSGTAEAILFIARCPVCRQPPLPKGGGPANAGGGILPLTPPIPAIWIAKPGRNFPSGFCSFHTLCKKVDYSSVSTNLLSSITFCCTAGGASS